TTHTTNVGFAEANKGEVEVWPVVTGCDREPSTPDLPTIVELGWPNAEVACAANTSARIFLAAPNLAQEKVEVLREAMTIAMDDEEWVEQAESLDMPPAPFDHEVVADYIQ